MEVRVVQRREQNFQNIEARFNTFLFQLISALILTIRLESVSLHFKRGAALQRFTGYSFSKYSFLC